MFPHCLLIVSHLEPFVKRFFKNSLAIPDIFLGGQLLVSWLHHQGLAFVSCVSPTLFQPVGSGSHLYSAHRNTVRSGHRVKGLTDSRGSFPLGLPCPRLLYPYCITTWEICQEVFYIFFNQPDRGNSPTRDAVLFNLVILLTSLTLYHNLGDLSRGFLHFFSKAGAERSTSYAKFFHSLSP